MKISRYAKLSLLTLPDALDAESSRSLKYTEFVSS